MKVRVAASVPPSRVAPITPQPRPAVVPKLDRLEIDPGRGGATLRDVESLLGFDLGALRDLAARELVGGHIELRLVLDDAVTWTVPMPGRDPLHIEIPRSPYGTEACFRIDVGAPSDGSSRQPVILGLALSFDTPGRAARPELPPMPRSAYPKILNPSAFDAVAPSSLGGRVLARAKDAIADVRVRELSLAESGEIQLRGEVLVAGRDHQDLATISAGKLPIVDTRLGALRGVIAGAKPTSMPRPTPLKDLLALFSKLASGGRFEAELTLGADRAGRAPAKLHTSGELRLNQDLDMRGSGKLGVEVGRGSVELTIEGQSQTYKTEGELRVAASVGKRRLSEDVRWNMHGMTLGRIDVDRVLPVRLKPAIGRAPAIGSPEFAARIDALLGPAIPGCRVKLLSRGDAVLAKRLELIEKARAGDTVVLQTFIFKDDVTGTKLIDALVAARTRGATVKVLVDAIGSVTSASDLALGPRSMQKLVAAGVDVVRFNVPGAPIAEHFGESAAASRRAFRREMSRHVKGGLGGLSRTTGALDAAGLTHLARLVETLASAKNPDELLGDPRRLIALAAAAFGAKNELDGARGILPTAALKHLTVLLSRELLDQVPAVLRGLGRDHRKILAVYGDHDGVPFAELNTGGNNIGDDYLLQPGSPLLDERHRGMHLWNDADLHIEGSAIVARATAELGRTWSGSGGSGAFPPVPSVRPATGPEASAVRLVQHHPMGVVGEEGDDHYANTLLAALEGLSPGDLLSIQNPYFLPLPELRDAMVAAARRGARICIVTNGLAENNDNLLVARLSRRFVLPALVAEPNIEVYETAADAQPIHRKTLAIRTSEGADLYSVGSHNLDHLSARINREMFVLGGTALDPAQSGPDPVVEELLADLRRDTGASAATRVRPADLTGGDLDALADDWVSSLLLPVL